MKSYKVSKHAVERAVERLKIPKEYAQNHLVQLMQSAFYNGDTPQPSGKMAKIFDHYQSRTRLIVGDKDTIITVYKMPEFEAPKPTVFADDIKQVVKRKYTQLQRKHKRTTRQLEIEIAELNLQVAQLRLNLAKARSPKVCASIKAKIDELVAKMDGKKSEIDAEIERFTEIKKSAEVYL